MIHLQQVSTFAVSMQHCALRSHCGATVRTLYLTHVRVASFAVGL